MKARFAHVGSLGTSSFLAPMGGIALFQASLVAAEPKYAQLCRDLSAKMFTILDCGALEVAIGTEQTEVSARQILDMSIDLRVSEVVCSDTPDNPRRSLLRSLEFIRLWKRLPIAEYKPRIMAVPHALTSEAWLSVAELLLGEVPESTIGIPRLFAKKCGNGRPAYRILLAKALASKFPMLQIHFLGAGEDFLAEMSHIASAACVRSVDSTFIHRYAMTGMDPTREYARPLSLRDDTCPEGFQRRASVLARLLRVKGRSHA